MSQNNNSSTGAALNETYIGKAVATSFVVTRSDLERFTADYIAGAGINGAKVGVIKHDDERIGIYAFIPANSATSKSNSFRVPSHLRGRINMDSVSLTGDAIEALFPLVYGCAKKENDGRKIRVKKVNHEGFISVELNIFAVLNIAMRCGSDYKISISESNFIGKELALVVTKQERQRNTSPSADAWMQRFMENESRGRRF